MAITITCDGCSEPIEGEPRDHEVGLYKKVHYCPDCRAIYDDFEEKVQLRAAEDAGRFQDWLTNRRIELQKDHGFKRLPDE